MMRGGQGSATDEITFVITRLLCTACSAKNHDQVPSNARKMPYLTALPLRFKIEAEGGVSVSNNVGWCKLQCWLDRDVTW